MRKEIHSALCAAIIIASTLHPLFAEEKRLFLGGTHGWGDFAQRTQIQESSQARAVPALGISSERAVEDPRLDMAISFDKSRPLEEHTGNYILENQQSIQLRSPEASPGARAGNGAALFLPQSQRNFTSALRATPTQTGLFYRNGGGTDFSIEFWLYPHNLSNGEQILSWTASPRTGRQEIQRIRVMVLRNKLEWQIRELFVSADRTKSLPLSIVSRTVLVPGRWSHHLLRFDSSSGLLEYLIDGSLQEVRYQTATGHEGGEIYLPRANADGVWEFGTQFTGMLDEFRIYKSFLEDAQLERYPLSGGRIESILLDLETPNARFFGVQTTNHLPAESEIRLFYRVSDNPWQWMHQDDSWKPLPPNSNLNEIAVGRWLQLAAQFYPDATGEQTPWLESIAVRYQPHQAPRPPKLLEARALDGKVELRWKHSPDADTAGYLLYYGTRKGSWFGTGADAGASPIDLGKRDSVILEGLENGTLYFFTLAAYDASVPRRSGEFSVELSARPSRME